MQQKIRVMVVDDSLVFRTWLMQSLSADPRFEVVGYAVNALDAKGKLPLLKPDIMTLDIEMPGMSGLDFLKEVLPSQPVPVILVSSLNVRVFDAKTDHRQKRTGPSASVNSRFCRGQDHRFHGPGQHHVSSHKFCL